MRFFFQLVCALCLINCTSSSKIKKIVVLPWSEHFLANGLQVFFVVDESTPLFHLSLIVNAGHSNESIETKGLATIVSQLLPMGGSQRSASQIAESIGRTGAELKIQVENDYAEIGLTGFSQQKIGLTNDLVSIVTQPSFKVEDVRRALGNFSEQSVRRSHEPQNVSQALFKAVIKGEGPTDSAGMRPQVQFAKKMARKDLIRFYLENYRPNQSVLVVSGRFNPEELLLLLEEKLRDWTPRSSEPESKKPIIDLKQNQFVLNPIKEATYASLRWGGLLHGRRSPKFFAQVGALELYKRAIADLAKNHKSFVAYDFQFSKNIGLFQFHFASESQKVQQGLLAFHKFTDQIRKEGFTQLDWDIVKQKMLLQKEAELSNSFYLAKELGLLGLFKIAPSQVVDWPKRFNDLSLSELNNTFNELTNPDNMVIVGAGAVDGLREGLSFLDR